MDERTANIKRLVPLYIACYLFWVGFIALTFWTLVQWRRVLFLLLPRTGPWVFMAIDRFGVLLIGLFAFGWLIFLETYFREGIGKGHFWPRVVRVATIQVIVLAVAYGVLLLDWLF